MFKKFNQFLNESSFSGQLVIKKEYSEMNDFKDSLTKEFPNWSFKVINTQKEHPRIKGQTLTYSSPSSTSKEEMAKVKDEIRKFKDS